MECKNVKCRYYKISERKLKFGGTAGKNGCKFSYCRIKKELITKGGKRKCF